MLATYIGGFRPRLQLQHCDDLRFAEVDRFIVRPLPVAELYPIPEELLLAQVRLIA
jgi:hypothetical protein